MNQYPIWHDVSACHYKSSKSYGGKNNSVDTIYVGRGSQNSHKLISHSTIRREYTDIDDNHYVEFNHFVAGAMITKVVFEADRNYKIKGKPITVIQADIRRVAIT